MQGITKYFSEARTELSKVSWPTRRQAVKLTIALIIFCAVVGAFIGVVDYFFRQGLERLILKV